MSKSNSWNKPVLELQGGPIPFVQRQGPLDSEKKMGVEGAWTVSFSFLLHLQLVVSCARKLLTNEVHRSTCV